VFLCAHAFAGFGTGIPLHLTLVFARLFPWQSELPIVPATSLTYRACDPPKPDEICCYYALSVVAMAVINAMEEMYLFDWLRDKRTS